MEKLRRLGLAAIPMTFLFAGAGMLWLGAVENAPGPFYSQVEARESDWVGAHVLLLISTVWMLPAALALRSAIERPRAGAVADFAVFLIAPTAILLAGQYAIDFVVPLMVEVGGDGLRVHALLAETPLLSTLFYGLPNLVFLAFLLLSGAVVWSGAMPRRPGALLMLDWLAVLLGNLVDPLFQRVAILLLAVLFVPLVLRLWVREAPFRAA